MHSPSPSSSKAPIWSVEHARLLVDGRVAAGLDSAALATQNTMSLKQLDELENGGCTAFYSESIKYTTGVKVLRKLQVSFDHLEIVHEPMPWGEEQAQQVGSDKNEPIRASSGFKNSLNFGSYSLSWWILAMLTLLIGLFFGLFPVEEAQLPEQVSSASQLNEAKLNAKVEVSGAPSPSLVNESAVTTLATGPLPKDALEKSARYDLCAFTGRGVELTPNSPSRPGEYVYLTATQKTQVCIRDATGKTTTQTLDTNQSRNVPGVPPFQLASESLADVKIFYQGQRVHAPSGIDFLILKGVPFNADRVE